MATHCRRTTRPHEPDAGTVTLRITAGEEYTAGRVVEMADRVMRDSAAFLGYTPPEKVPVVIYGATSEANGFFTPLPPHIAIFVASPQWDDFAGGGDWIELVFLHELVHYVHFMRPQGIFGQISRVLGAPAVLPNLFLVPGWMIEGPTVYAETALIRGGRGETPFFEATNAALILEDQMYSYRQAGYGSPLDWGRFYNSGYLMVDYLQRTYGDDACERLNRSAECPRERRPCLAGPAGAAHTHCAAGCAPAQFPPRLPCRSLLRGAGWHL